MRAHRFVFALGLVFCAPIAACGSDDTSGEGEEASTTKGGEDPKQGFTECGEFTCQPGQHCDNFVCLDGCQSNVNCAADQSCESIDENLHVGTCKNKGPVDPGKDCNAFCQKAMACNAPNVGMCQQICAAASSECVSCVIDSNCGSGCEAPCGAQ